MGYHNPEIVSSLKGKQEFRGSCSCGAAGFWTANRQEAEDFLVQHQQQVERARSHLRSRTPPLASQADYYREQAAKPGVSDEDRVIWEQLAHELDTRLGKYAPPSEQLELLSTQDVKPKE